MSLESFKTKADEQADYDDFKSKYEAKKSEIKRQEIDKIKAGFKQYFESDADFTTSDTDSSIVAKYKDTQIVLMEDEQGSHDDPSLSVNMMIQLPDKKICKFRTASKQHSESRKAPDEYPESIPKLNATEEDEHARRLRNLEYYKDLVNGTITYTLSYYLKDTKEEFASIEELMKSIL